jgi:hypothetical protein
MTLTKQQEWGRNNDPKTERNNEIYLHYASGDDTLDTIGKRFGLTRERVRQVIHKYVDAGRLSRTQINVATAMGAVRRAGTWEEAAEISGESAGTLYRMAEEMGMLPAIQRLYRLRKRAKMLARLRAVRAEIGRPFKGGDFSGPTQIKGLPGSATLRRHFGTIRNAVKLAGLECDWPKGGSGRPRKYPTATAIARQKFPSWLPIPMSHEEKRAVKRIASANHITTGELLRDILRAVLGDSD